jgi:hypothetical protein
VQSTDALIRNWRDARRGAPFYSSMTFLDQGLVLGFGTTLARFAERRKPLDLTGNEAHVLALLAAAYDRRVSGLAIETIRRAGEAWQSGDEALALIRLAFLRLPQIETRGAYRLDLAAGLLETGFSPRVLLTELGFPSVLRELDKFNPDQPRVPAGSGQTCGRWTSGSDVASITDKPSQQKTFVTRADVKIVGRHFIGRQSRAACSRRSICAASSEADSLRREIRKNYEAALI